MGSTPVLMVVVMSLILLAFSHEGTSSSVKKHGFNMRVQTNDVQVQHSRENNGADARIPYHPLKVSNTSAQNFSVDIHLLLDQEGNDTAISINAFFRDHDPTESINLNVTAAPHITLYLTMFETVYYAKVMSTLALIAPSFQPCPVVLTDVFAQGTYAMWNVTNSECLQNNSNTVVMALNDFITPNQSIPSWVNSLPEPERTEKIDMIEQFGSPNVFSQFQPHVSVAGDDNPAGKLTKIVAELYSSNIVNTHLTTSAPPLPFIGLGSF
eukprot:TRINITY_DN4073_c0_g1_i1.p1 TRINITY_DN4073_c0_g1~~TRINITY_DN4073_c0_g1_i1.p1  ORF type:complete len:268 (+),score=49.85 TRINITY_DN4073_c0_g1_i1:125-928(+)